MTSRVLPAPTYSAREVFAALLHPAVIVGALGYFVDIYDLILFTVVRIPSLKALGLTGEQLVNDGIWLFNVQMAGMLIGGLIWGLLGDRFGRLSLLFGSIILYSLANIANGFVQDLDTYTVLRFLAGIGLAGELGGSITLVAEVLPCGLRGFGTMLVTAIGVLGALAAAEVSHWFDWRVAFMVGGGLGLLLLFLRVLVSESGLYTSMVGTNRPTFASQLLLLAMPRRLGRYLCCILVGLPCWYVVGLVIAYSNEFSKAMGAPVLVDVPTAVATCYGGICVGDLLSGGLSQWARSRKKVLLGFLLATLALFNLFFNLHEPSLSTLYRVIFLLGIAVGYWAVFVTVAAEHFGTNMRATVATTVPNFSRGVVIPVTMLFLALKTNFGYTAIHAAVAVGWLSLILALVGWWGLRETFHDDLDYLET